MDVAVVGAISAGIGAAVAASRARPLYRDYRKIRLSWWCFNHCMLPLFNGFGVRRQADCGGVADELVRELERLSQAAFVVDPAHSVDNKPSGNRPILD